MVCTSRRDVISELRVFPSFALIRKAREAPAMSTFNLASYYTKRDIELAGTENLNLDGVARLLGRRIAATVKRRLRRKR